jgi:hypothetical protein
MWLLISAMTALIVTAVYLFYCDKYKIGTLALVFWGLTVCIFIDHTLTFFMEGGGEYPEISAEALVLSFCMIVPIFMVWEVYVAVVKLREKHISDMKEVEKIAEGV